MIVPQKKIKIFGIKLPTKYLPFKFIRVKEKTSITKEKKELSKPHLK